jgi:acyl-CoA synthetase (AMP-forming)/AMP-acid ligase II
VLVADILRRNARRVPEKAAVVFEDRRLTWREVDERADRVAAYFRAQGLGVGDRVAVCAPNTLEWIELVYGISKAGLVLVPVNARLAAPEVDFQLRDAGCRAGVFHSTLSEEHLGSLSGLEVELVIGEESDYDTSKFVPYESALESVEPQDPCLDRHDERYAFLYTSGTTGRPKGAVISKSAMLVRAIDAVITTQSRPDDVGLAITPFFTSGGTRRTLAWTYLGQTMVIVAHFDPDQALDLIREHRVTVTTLVPTMLQRLLDAFDPFRHDVSSLRCISYGSAPAPLGLAARAMDLLRCDLQQRYGQTETGQVTVLTPEDHLRMMNGARHLEASCGRETPQALVKIVDENGDEVPANVVGEIVIESESSALGYHNLPEGSADKFREDGIYTHDVGYRDEEGYFYVIGRNIDMIISGGFNVYPAEIERVIATHPEVQLVTVVGVPDATWGETPVAVVVPCSSTVDVEALEFSLREICRAKLAGYKQPRRLVFWHELPLTPAGKIRNEEIRRILIAAGEQE